MDLLERAGELKGELVGFALSARFDDALGGRIWETFRDGIVDDEGMLHAVIEDFIFNHRLAGGDLVVEKFVAERKDLLQEDRTLLLGWRDRVQGIFEVQQSYGADGVIAFNHVDELTYQVRSNMGPQGVEPLTPGTVVIAGIVPVGDDWMISGTPMAFPSDQAEHVLAGLPDLIMNNPKAVFRNPDKLAQARKMQDEQRQAFIDLYGADLVVVPGADVEATTMAVYRHAYERAGSQSGPWTDPGLPALPEEWTGSANVALIFDEEDGLGFYVDYALARQAFADPRLVRARPYRDIISGYLREDGVSPVPIQRLAAEHPHSVDHVFRTLLKKPKFCWDRDGEALLRRYKSDWYAEPQLPRVTPISPGLVDRFRSAGV